MRIQRGRTFMTAIVDHASAFARRLEDDEARRLGVPIDRAREAVARKTGVATGTLENLRRGRVKTVGHHVFKALSAAFVREIEAEILRLSHELEVARLASDRLDADAVLAAEAALATAREAVGRVKS